MALSENRILKSVEVLAEQGAVNVLWEDQILRDGEMVSSVPFRCAYAAEDRDKFLAEVPNADQYVLILGW